MAVEIKQALEREFELNLTAQDLRVLTFAKLQELTDKGTDGKIGLMKSDESINLADIQKNMLLRSCGNEETANDALLPLNTIAQNSETDALGIFISGVEGVISPVLYKMCKNIEIPMYALQLHCASMEDNFPNLMATFTKVGNLIFPSWDIPKNTFFIIFLLQQDVMDLFENKKRFYLIGHSFGGIVAIELAKMLEKKGLTGQVVSIDGSILLFKRFIKGLMPTMEDSYESIQNFLLQQLAFEILPDQQPDAIRKVLEDEKTMDGRINKYISLMPKQEYSTEYLTKMGYGLQNRFKIVLNENEEYSGEKIQSNITLIRPTTNLFVDIENDYKLTQYTSGNVFVSFIDGTHLSMLDNMQLYELINNICTNNSKA